MNIDYEQRYKELNEGSNSTILQQNNKLINKPKIIVRGFINNRTIIKPYSNDKIGFKIDDEQIYEYFIREIKNVTERNFGDDINIIQNYINKYFVGGTEEVEKVVQSNINIHSIKEYKNKGGQCIHMSALANNLLQILGYNCEMIWSNIGGENHAFLIIHANDKHYIYDPSNRSKLYVSSDKYYKIPTLVEKSQEDIKLFYNNKKNLMITDEDEKSKNKKQNNQNIKLQLPKLEYSCRNFNEYIDTQNTIDKVIDDYINNLKNKGLSEQEIQKILIKIRNDISNNIKPKVENLNEIYSALENSEVAAKHIK